MAKSVKTKKDRQPPEPRKIFTHACSFVKADDALKGYIRGRPNNEQAEMAVPMLVANAFAIELFLKCLLVIDKIPFPDTHDLAALFRRLRHKRQREIERLWDEGPRKKIELFARQQGLPSDLPNALVKCAKAFNALRYAYEDSDNVVHYLGELPMLLVRYIGDLNPDWIEWIEEPAAAPRPAVKMR